MIVFDIKRDKTHLMRVILDNGAEILLDKDTVAENPLKKGDFIDKDKIDELSYDSEYRRAKSRALWYLDRMDYTEKSLYTKLVRAGFDKRASAQVLARLTELGVVDDMRYANRFAERCLEKNISKRETMHKMLEKGVPYDMAKFVLSDMEADEDSQLKALIEGKYAYKLTQDRGVEKVYAALVRKGFSYSAVKQALKNYVEDFENCEEC